MGNTSRIGVTLAFNADTSKAKAQLRELQQSLQSLSSNTAANMSSLVNTKEIDSAIKDVEKLSAVLKNSTTSAGTLDITKFSKGLNQAGLSAKKIQEQLSSLGPSGAKAFAQLTESVMKAEIPLKRTNKAVSEFMAGLKRTAGWQIQSTMIHKFTGAIQQAYHYAKDLDKSLNSIRIVTGYSSDEMAKFAKQANKAAKELSTTTTAYTDAALIFYQQGLSGEAVTERTDTVIKMANVTKQSASEVSSYMTAIWNNFDDGSQSLEHYADVITALGASTASSSEEIATGLEKFAAIGNTVGLSYEYATTALATVVAQTRQSADTVGTAFKTLFARIQDLELGKTLDDGTTLGKYSQALQTIGVNIKDVNGQTKDMDQILDEMGSKWQTIDKNTQIAVAQAVAGTRQYSQLVALMDNWGKFQKNLDVAKNSDGSLQEQADIYAESWEAAEKRVRAAMEDIYSKIINDKFFIDLNNNIAKIIDSIGDFLKHLGGLKGLVPLIGSLLIKNFGTGLINSLGRAKQGLIDFTASAANAASKSKNGFLHNVGEKISGALQEQTTSGKAEQTTNSFVQAMQSTTMLTDNTTVGTTLNNIFNEKNQIYDTLLKKQKELANSNQQLSEDDKMAIQLGMERIEVLAKEAEEAAKLAQNSGKIYKDAQTKAKAINNEKGSEYIKNSAKLAITSEISNEVSGVENSKKRIDETTRKKISDKVTALSKKFKVDSKDIQNEIDTAKNYETLVSRLTKISAQLNGELQKTEEEIGEDAKAFKKLGQEAQGAVEAESNLIRTNQNLEDGSKGLQKAINDIQPQAIAGSQAITSFASSFMQLQMAMNSVMSLGDIWSDDDLSTPQKIQQTLMSLTMIIPMVIGAYKGLGDVVSWASAKQAASNAVEKKGVLSKLSLAIATKIVKKAEEGEAAAATVATAATMAFTAAIIAIVAVIAIFAAISAAHKKKLEENAEKTKEAAEANKEYRESLEKEAEAMKNLQNEYDNLLKQYQEGKLTYEEMRNKAYDLCMQYDRQDLALQALTGDYESLASAIKKANGEKAQEVADAAEFEAGSYKEALKAGLVKTDEDNVNINTGIIDLDGKDAALKKQLEQLGVIYTTDESMSLESFVKALSENGAEVKKALAKSNSDTAKQLKKYLADNKDVVDGLINSIDVYNKNILESIGSKYADIQINTIAQYTETIRQMAEEALNAGAFSSMSEAEEWANTYMSAIDSVRKYAQDYARASNIVDKLSDKIVINDAEETREQAIENTKNEFKSKKERQQAETQKKADDAYTSQLLDSMAGGVAVATPVAMAGGAGILSLPAAIIGSIAGGLGGLIHGLFSGNDAKNKVKAEGVKELEKIDKEEKAKLEKIEKDYAEAKEKVTKTISDFSEVQKNFYSQNAYLLSDAIGEIAEGDSKYLDTINEKYKDAMTYMGALSGAEYIKSLVQEMGKSGDALSGEAIEKLKSDFGEAFEDINLDSLYGKDAAAQMTTLLGSLDSLDQKMQENAEAYRQSAEDNFNKFVETNRKKVDSYKAAEDKMNEYAKQSTISRSKLQDLAQAYSDVGGEVKALPKEMQELYKSLKEKTGATDEEIEATFKSIINNKEAADTYHQLEQAMNSSQKAQISFKDRIEMLDNAEKAYNKALDDTQNAYKTLKQAAEEYNSQGFMSLDTLQSLLKLEPKYLSCLIDENGQFNINTESLLNYTKAQLLNYKYQQALELASVLHSAVMKEEGYETKLATAALNSNTDAIGSNTEAKMRDAKVELEKLRIAAEAAGHAGQAEEDYQSALNYYNSTLMAFSALDNEIANLSLENFDKIMGASKKAAKYYEDEYDRYFDVNQAIKEVTRSISRLEKEQSKLFGDELVGNIEKVNKALAEQKANYEALLKMQRQEQSELRTYLEGKDVKFDENGRITNYAEVTTKMFKSQDGMDSEAYSLWKKNLEKYISIQESIEDTIDKINETHRKQLENNLKVWETKIQIRVDKAQAQKDANQFTHDLQEDFQSIYKDFDKEFDHVQLQINAHSGIIDADLEALQNARFELEKMESGGSSNMFESISQAQEKVKALTEKVRNDYLDLKELIKDAWDTYLDSIDQAKDKFDELNERYERMNDLLDHQKQLVELIYGSQDFDKLLPLLDAQIDASSSRMETLKKEELTWKEAYEDALEKYGPDSEATRKALENYRNATAEIRAEELNHVQLLKEKYEKTIDDIARRAKREAAGGEDLDWTRTKWDDSQRKQDGVYDNVEKVYELNSLRSKWNNLISDTTGLKNQQKLRDVMAQQFDYLEGKTELTEYDIGLAEKQLEIEKARIALEEAQNAKNSMKLVRNAEGNWSYQYVADEDNVSQKEQDLADKTHDYYEYVKTANKDALGSILDLTNEYWDRWSEIMKDSELSEEERNQRVLYLKDLYYGEDGFITKIYRQSNLTQDQLNEATYNSLKTYYELDKNNYQLMTEAEQKLIDGLRDGTISNMTQIKTQCEIINAANLLDWQTTAYEMSDAWNKDEDGVRRGVEKAMDAGTIALDEFMSKATQYANDKTIQKAVEDVKTEINNVETATDDLVNETSDKLATYNGIVSSLASLWGGVKDGVEEAMGQTKEYISTLEELERQYNLTNNAVNGSKTSGTTPPKGPENPKNPENPKTPEQTETPKQLGTVRWNGYSIQNGSGDWSNRDLYFSYNGEMHHITRDDEVGLYEAMANELDVDQSQLKFEEADYKWASDWKDKATVASLKASGWKNTTNRSDEAELAVIKNYMDNAHVQMVDGKPVDLVYASSHNSIPHGGGYYEDVRNLISYLTKSSKFNTGGYTGEWDSSGKLAVLHQKELILNQEDTKNMLNAVEAVRGITSSIGSSLLADLAKWASGVSSLSPAAIGGSSTVDNSSANNVFNITAEFPNANDVDEIREAILSLPNLASQYMNVKTI